MSLILYLVRHGQTDWNAQRRLQGAVDIPLNSIGWSQAARLVRALGAAAIDQVYSSLLSRSRCTAEGFAGIAPITSLASLDEQALGIFEGRYLDGREPLVAETYFSRLARLDDSLDGGESVNRHYERVGAGLEVILGRHRRGRVVVVGHGATNAAMLRRLFGLSFAEGRALRPANGEVFVIDFAPSGRARNWRRAMLTMPPGEDAIVGPESSEPRRDPY